MKLSSHHRIPNVETFLEYCKLRQYPKKSIILGPDDPNDALLYIIEGSVAITIRHNKQQEMIVTYLNEGSFIGEGGFFDPEAKRTSYVRAKTDCIVGMITYERLHEVLQEHPEFLKPMVHQLVRRLKEVTRKAGDLFFMDVTGRVSHTLLELTKQPEAETHPDGMQIKVTRQEISNIVGCSREMVGRVLRALEDRGMVESHGKTLVVYAAR